MQANELRIGNWVIKNDGVEDYFHKVGPYDIVSMDNLQPIPLTPVILKKAGFKYSASFGDCMYEKDELQMDENFNPYVREGDEYLYYGNQLEFVHELQNLYFALNKKELEIQL